MRGEDSNTETIAGMRAGSPPHARGRRPHRDHSGEKPGITPAEVVNHVGASGGMEGTFLCHDKDFYDRNTDIQEHIKTWEYMGFEMKNVSEQGRKQGHKN